MSFLLDERQQHFLDLLEPIRPGLARYCRAISRDADDARDLMSETILVAYEHLDSMNGKSESFSSYLFTTATRLNKRWRWRNKKKAVYDPQLAEQIQDSSSAPDAAADNELLYGAIQKLPKPQAEALVLFEISGLSLLEIQEVQGGSLSGVKSRIARAREKLATLLGAHEEPRRSVVVTSPPTVQGGLEFAQTFARRGVK
ncbi:MAG: RNA polymerase sigma factor [bacterium]